MASPEPSSVRRAFDGTFIKVDVEEWPGGEREIVKHPGACAVVAITAEGEVLLVRQFREALRRETLEIPAGVLEEGESGAECAARELLEETGYRAIRVEPLATIFTSPGFTDEKIELFLAEAEQVGEGTEEAVELVRMPLDQALKEVTGGAILDAKTAIALMLAKD
ncbi:MAG: NUDIX hydrolase [Actinobacteria bacterium]|nr:MAG: NUDIX hydrolase [Actinomycetota bacterium]